MTFLETSNTGGMSHLLTIVTFLPALGAVLLAIMGKERERDIKYAAFFISILTALASLPVWVSFAVGGGMQHVENVEWFHAFGVNVRYAMGVDGLALAMVMLTTLITPIVMVSSFGAIQKYVKEYFIAMLILETGMIGSFCALDLFLFYVFFEVMLIPMYLLIGVWGGPNRVYAAVKFFIYTLVGSLLMFVAILYCYYAADADTFMIADLQRLLPGVWANPENATAAMWCFMAFMLSFAIKTPVFPVHTWLPDAHTEAPTGGSVILAAVLLKLGTYGMLRFGLGFFPAQAYEMRWLFVLLAVIGIVYGALMALAQEDLKKLVAYSSVSHLGFVVLGIFAFNNTAVEGAVLQMINHGLSTGLLFLLVGVIYERRHTRLIEEYGGLARVMPKYAIIFLITTLASIGLPGLNGFVGEFMILIGSFGALQAPATAFEWNWMHTATLLAGTGVILGAVYMLWAYQRVFFGKVTRKENAELKDLSRVELGYLVPLVVACFAVGLQPAFLLDRIKPSVSGIVEHVAAHKPAAAKTTLAAGAGDSAVVAR